MTMKEKELKKDLKELKDHRIDEEKLSKVTGGICPDAKKASGGWKKKIK